MFLALKNGLGRLTVFFRGLFDEYGGAAAAYSLRRLGSAYSGPLVRVRRDGDADGTTNERDFTSTTQIADWVNGKLETTLPADVATSSAAYSLRKVKAGYTGDAVRIRRASDDVEVDVAFDTNGVVSANSAITNIPEEFLSNDFTDGWVEEAGATIVDSNTFTTSANAQGISLAVANGTKLKITVAGTATGASYRIYDWSDGGIKATLSGTFSTTVEFTTVGNQSKIYFRSTGAGTLDVTSLTIEVINDAGGDTTATTLGGFLTESVNIYASDYSAGVDGWTTTGNGNLAGDIDGIGGRDDNLRFTSAVSDVDVFSYHRRNNVLELGQKYNVTFDFYIPSSNSRLDQIKEIVVGGPTIDLSSFTALDQWVSVSVTTTIGATTNLILIRWEDSSESGDATGDVAYIRNVSINAVGHKAHVHTWYDQSANSNHATQNTSGDQPKIAEAGALLANGIDFDGSSSNLDMPSVISSVALASSFVVAKASNVSHTGIALALSRNNPDQRWYSPAFISGTSYFGYGDSASKINLGATDTNEHLFSAIADSSNATAFLDATSKGSTAVFTGTGLLTSGGIGAVNETSFYEGSIKEIVVYNSDQTDNRFKIESNINNYYGIYTASHNGFVHTWYDQSGNSNHATQDTQEGDQPKIVNAGSLLSDIDFAGDTFLQTTSLQEQVPVSFFCVNRFDSTLTGLRPFLGNGILDGFSQGYGLYYSDPSNTFTTQVRIPSSADNIANSATTIGDSSQLTTAFITASTVTSFYNGANESSATNNQGAITPNRTLTIGGSETGGTPAVTRFFNGGISEIVLYPTDQSANRSGIESNIADHYGITLP